MKKIIIITGCLLLMLSALNAQQPDLLNKKFSRYLHPASKPGWIQFRKDAPYTADQLFQQQPDLLGLKGGDEMRIFKTNTDVVGNNHVKYAQYYNNIRVEGVEHIVHERNGGIHLANGYFIAGLNLSVTPAINPSTAIEAALKAVPAEKYLWEDAEQEANFKKEKKDVNATLYPTPELLIVKKDPKDEKIASNYTLAYRMYVFAKKPYAAKYVYVDAQTGELLRTADMDQYCSPGTVQTTWHGQRTIHTKYTTEDCWLYEETSYFSWDDCNPDTEIKSWWSASFDDLLYGEDYLLCDNDNDDWGFGSGTDKMTATTLWAAKQTYLYFLNEHDHESYDGSDGLIDVFSNKTYFDDEDDPHCSNANWQPVLDNIYFGSGADCISGTTDDFNTLDIVGHEYTHGIVYYAHIDPLYSFGEAAALNESLADIFGEIVEESVENSIDWIHGGDKTAGGFRDMSNPQMSSSAKPDTYFGDDWDLDAEEHQNSTVQSFMFYLLSEGGTGVNDHGVEYNVEGIGWQSARDIAWQAMMNYLNSYDDYKTARNAWIQSAIDLFGSCSQEMISVGQAWQAVGVTEYTSYDLSSFCGTYNSFGIFDATYGIENATILGGDFVSNCTTTVNSLAVVTLESAYYIELHPGFEAKSGSLFTALIDECEVSDYDSGDLKENGSQEEESQFLAEEASGLTIYPIPADQSVSIAFHLAGEGRTNITLLDVSGRTVSTWMKDELLLTGKQQLTFSTKNLTSGVYLCLVESGNKRMSKKLMVQH